MKLAPVLYDMRNEPGQDNIDCNDRIFGKIKLFLIFSYNFP